MKTYTGIVTVVGSGVFRVEAENEEDAKRMVEENGEWEFDECHELDIINIKEEV